MKPLAGKCLVAAVVWAACMPVMPAAAPSGEDEVRAVLQNEIAAWGRFDAAGVASFYTADATFQNPFGVRLHGREQLQKFLTKLFARPGYRSAKDVEPPHITDVRMLSATSAVGWAEEKSEGQVDDQTGKKMAPRYSHYLEVLVKQDGKWLVTDSMVMDEYQK